MAKRRPNPSPVPKAAQEELLRLADDVVEKTKEILDEMNADFKRRRAQVRKEIANGARKTTGRIV